MYPRLLGVEIMGGVDRNNRWTCGTEDIKNMWEPLMNATVLFLDVILGCWHFNMSRPCTISGRTYKVCLDCGKQFSYSLRTMSLTTESFRVLSSQHHEPLGQAFDRP